MWKTIRDIWAEAMRPEGRLANAYLDFQHQFSKAWLGVGVMVTVCVIYDAIFGAMPYRTLVFSWLVGAYFGLVEIAGQGWRGRDTLDDTYFFAIGAAGPVVSLREVETNLGLMLDLSHAHVLGAVAILLISLVFYAGERRRA